MEQLEGPNHEGIARGGAPMPGFTVHGEVSAAGVLGVQELRGYPVVTPIPGLPRHVRGVMTLRGLVIPVIDLRRQAGMPEARCAAFTVIAALTVGSMTVGVIVDSVSDVLERVCADVRGAEGRGVPLEAGISDDMETADDRLAPPLDIDRLLGCRVLGSSN